MEKKDLAVKEKALFTREAFDEPRNFTELLSACEILVASKILPREVDTKEKAAVVILTGRELGLRMMASLRSVYVVNQKPSLSAQMMLALAHQTGELEDYEIKEEGEKESSKCTVTVKRRGKKPYTCSFSVDEAKAMQKYANEWLKQPGTMCRSRAISKNMRVTFPDAILGLYTPEETESIEYVPDPPKEPEMPRAKETAKTGENKPVSRKETAKPLQAQNDAPTAQESISEAPKEATTTERPMPAGYDLIKAVQDGKCKGCKQVIPNGKEFFFSAKKGSFHVGCEE